MGHLAWHHQLAVIALVAAKARNLVGIIGRDEPGLAVGEQGFQAVVILDVLKEGIVLELVHIA